MTKAEIKGDIERSYKENYFYECRKSKRSGNSDEVYTFGMIQKLRDMAENGVYPDWNFSDQECNVWSMFRNFQRKDESRRNYTGFSFFFCIKTQYLHVLL